MPSRATALIYVALIFSIVASSRDAAAQVFLPGKLIRGHAPWESQCQACHAKGKKGDVDSARCLSCHKALNQQIRRKRGYHGKQGLVRCVKCHLDHLGRNYKAIRWPGGQKNFDHRRTGYALTGKHKGPACRKCHQPKNIRSKRVRAFSASRRAKTFLGLKQRCGSCHDDVHKGKLGSRCQSCHAGDAFKPVKSFSEHNRTRFPLVGKHQSLACAKCHKGANKAGGWAFRGLRFSSCADCHKTPHRGGRMGQSKTPPTPCSSCHTERSWRKTRFAKRSHPGMVLRGAHARASCRKCHGVKANKQPAGKRCASCHKDPHRAKFGSGCAKCHSEYGWWKRKGTIVKMGKSTDEQRSLAASIGISAQKVQAVAFHNKTRYPLTGKHVVVRCAECHRKRRGRRRYKRIKNLKFQRCTDCHKDPHRGSLSAKGRRCEQCHETRGFELVSFGQKEHAKTKMVLKDAHQSVPCASCHPRSLPPKKRFARRHAKCNDCHKDPHRGRFRLTKNDKPLACETCHDQRSWHKQPFDHDKTRFALEGAHRNAACLACHKKGRGGVTTFRGLDKACRSCHADPHQGQFTRSAPRKDCGDCHGSKSFKIKRFDHGKRGGMVLGGVHEQLKCKRCHYPVKLKNGRKVRLYRLGAKGCDACHKPHHTGLRKRALSRIAPLARQAHLTATKRRSKLKHGDPELRKCERCHKQASWQALKSTVSSFDHGQVGYPLRGAHATASCARCHRPKKAATRQCASCHKDPHGGKLGPQCADCHDARRWKVSKTLALHRKTRLPLTGWHALADCASCHPRNRSGDYRGTPAACVACHAEQYNAPRTHPNHRAVGFGQRCEQCHRPTGWRPATAAARQNSLVAHRRLPLTGGHAKLDCVRCHQKSRPVPSCGSCHRRQARKVQRPDHGAPGFSSRCEHCHQPASWRPARLPPKHSFALSGKHRQLACQDCHTDSTRFSAFRCAGACHQPRLMLRRHRQVRGFSLTPAGCKRCHPGGRR